MNYMHLSIWIGRELAELDSKFLLQVSEFISDCGMTKTTCFSQHALHFLVSIVGFKRYICMRKCFGTSARCHTHLSSQTTKPIHGLLFCSKQASCFGCYQYLTHFWLICCFFLLFLDLLLVLNYSLLPDRGIIGCTLKHQSLVKTCMCGYLLRRLW